MHPETCKPGAADCYGVPGQGELLWRWQCGAIRVVSDEHEYDWELPKSLTIDDLAGLLEGMMNAEALLLAVALGGVHRKKNLKSASTRLTATRKEARRLLDGWVAKRKRR